MNSVAMRVLLLSRSGSELRLPSSPELYSLGITLGKNLMFLVAMAHALA